MLMIIHLITYYIKRTLQILAEQVTLPKAESEPFRRKDFAAKTYQKVAQNAESHPGDVEAPPPKR